MVRPPAPAELEALGLTPDEARELARRVRPAVRRLRGLSNPREMDRLWLELRTILLENPTWRWNFGVHRRLFDFAHHGRAVKHGPAPAWIPERNTVRDSNIGKLMTELHRRTYPALHRWSVERREEFWATVIRKLGIVFRTGPDRIMDPQSDVTRPSWLPNATLNIAESCFRADPAKVAILSGTEGTADVRRMTYGELRRLSNRVANGLERLGIHRGDSVGLYMPMTPESVAIYFGAVLAGRCIVGVAETSAPPELAKRLRIGNAKAVFTIDSYLRDGKEHRIYEKVVEANGPRAVVLLAEGSQRAEMTRPDDLGWDDFLDDGEDFDAVPCDPSDHTNILFSSGTTKDPKAIPWTHVTPIKAAADAYLHLDVRASDVVAWATSFGWMMGPWLTYGSLVNGATMALHDGAPQRREYGDFIARAGVTILGVVPKLVRSWKAGLTMEKLDWSRVRLFSSTAEPSSPEEMLYLMFLAGYKPIIEYCGGTEVGGGYITGTVVQPCSPSTFTTPALGLDFRILDDGHPAARGEVFLVPPSIGLSNELLNYDHFEEYYEGVPRGPEGEVLRRHGDQVERLAGGYYRHLGRIDDMINVGGVKTSAEEVRSVIAHVLVYDSKPAAVDVDGSGQHSLVIYAVLRDPGLASEEIRERLRSDFEQSIKKNLNPLLAHVHDVVLVSELPQAGPGKTRTMTELERDYQSRARPGGKV